MSDSQSSFDQFESSVQQIKEVELKWASLNAYIR
jgi:hypothetical protein